MRYMRRIYAQYMYMVVYIRDRRIRDNKVLVSVNE